MIKMLSWLMAGLKLIDSVVIFHPQSLGYALTASVIRSANKTKYWVLDTSLFCKKSYNHYNGKACLKCLYSFEPHSDCSHFPNYSSDEVYIKFQNVISNNLNKIVFHIQTKGHGELLKLRYGQATKMTGVKMLVPEFYKMKDYSVGNYEYDIGFHGNLVEGKGFMYTLDLSSNIKDSSFLMPGKKPKDIMGMTNVKYLPCTWDTGLDEALTKCKIILCPSIWTQPVEAAVIKSMLIGRPVGLIVSEYNFTCEIPDECYVALSGDAVDDAEILKSLLTNTQKMNAVGEKGKQWASKYI